MRTKKIIKIGNLFEFAENRLIERVKRGDISGYSLLDIIDNAVKVRKHLDKFGKIIIPKLTREEIKKNNRASRQRYYLKAGK